MNKSTTYKKPMGSIIVVALILSITVITIILCIPFPQGKPYDVPALFLGAKTGSEMVRVRSGGTGIYSTYRYKNEGGWKFKLAYIPEDYDKPVYKPNGSKPFEIFESQEKKGLRGATHKQFFDNKEAVFNYLINRRVKTLSPIEGVELPKSKPQYFMVHGKPVDIGDVLCVKVQQCKSLISNDPYLEIKDISRPDTCMPYSKEAVQAAWEQVLSSSPSLHAYDSVVNKLLY